MDVCAEIEKRIVLKFGSEYHKQTLGYFIEIFIYISNSTWSLFIQIAVVFCLRAIHSDERLTLETSVFESFTVTYLPYLPCCW